MIRALGAKLLNVEPGEGRLVAVLFSSSFLLGIATVFLGTAADTMFLVRYGTDYLPYVFFSTAVVVPLTGLAYAKLAGKLANDTRLGAATLGFLFVVTVAFWALIATTNDGWPVFVLRMFLEAASALTALTFWGPVGSMLDLRQAKRLYGLVGTGEVLAGIVGGVAVTPLLAVTGVPQLLLVAAAGFMWAVASLLYLARHRPEGASAVEDDDGPSGGAALVAIAKDRYVVLLVLSFLLYYVFYEVLKYTNLQRMEVRFGDDSAALASFLGALSAVKTVIVLSMRTFASGRLIMRLGLSFGLLSLPAVVIVGAAFVIAVALATSQETLLFWAVVVLGLVEDIVRRSLNKPASQVLFRPLGAARRARAQTVVETVADPLGTALAGAVLLGVGWVLASAGPSGKLVGLAVLMIVFLVLLAAVMIALVREYSGVVIDVLSKGHLRRVAVSLDQPGAVEVLEAKLTSADAAEVLYAMKVLERIAGRPRLVSLLEPLVRHPREEVRVRALEIVEQERLPELQPLVETALAADPAIAVRARAAAALASILEDRAVPILAPIAASTDDSPLRRAARVALLRYGGIPGTVVAGQTIEPLIASPDPRDRVRAAEVLGDTGIAGFATHLRHLLEDSDRAVQRAALEAAGKVDDARLWPLVAARLEAPAVRVTAIRALVRGGHAVLPLLDRLLADPTTKTAIARRVASAIGDIGEVAAIEVLLRHLDHPVGETQRAVLAALRKCDWRAGKDGADRVAERLAVEARLAGTFAAAIADVEEIAEEGALRRALETELARAKERVVSLVSFICPPQPISWARRYLESGSLEKKAYALEVIDTVVPQPLRALVFPVLDARPPRDAARALGGELIGAGPRITQILDSPASWVTPWLRVAARHAIRTAKLEGLGERVLAGGENDMTMLTIEKVLILRATPFFSTIDDDVLAEVADALEEVEVKAGERVITQGDTDASLYVIVRGKMRVHDRDRTLAHLGPREVVGDLSALDPDERATSVSAAEDSLLLRMEHATLMDVIEEHADVARGIIRFLVRRFRSVAAK